MKRKLLIAGLLSIVAALCGGGWAVAQQVPATEIVGGPGGNAFADPELSRVHA